MGKPSTPFIITFANQKGGVGKSTLCACFANYLSTMGVPIQIFDCDKQQSIAKFRQYDVNRLKTADTPYPVIGLKVMDRQRMKQTIFSIFQENNGRVSLFDCQGAMIEETLFPLIANTDILVVPFHYDKFTLFSTSETIFYALEIVRQSRRATPLKIFMIPNGEEKKVGTKLERELWDKAQKAYQNRGTVTPAVYRKSDIPRFSTLIDIDRHLELFKCAFEPIYTEMTGSTEPCGEPIQGVSSRGIPKDQLYCTAIQLSLFEEEFGYGVGTTDNKDDVNPDGIPDDDDNNNSNNNEIQTK